MRWRWRPGSGPRARAGPTAWDGGLVNKVITAASTSSVCLLFVHKLTLSSVIRNLSISSANSDGSRGPREGWPVVCCLSGQSSSVHQLPSPYQDNNITAARRSYKDKSAAAGPVIIISARSRLRPGRSGYWPTYSAGAGLAGRPGRISAHQRSWRAQRCRPSWGRQTHHI